ncbi:MAG: DUF6090 family protein [Steroidobacteraceae bacterium]
MTARAGDPRAVARRPWMVVARPLGEIAIVTVGILIAFALEAWWDGRENAAREQVHLRALASDLQQNVAGLKTLIGKEEEVMAGSEELLKLARAQQPGPTASLEELFNQVFNSARFEPVMGAYEALVNSGGLTLIRNEALRAALAELAAKVSGQYTESWSEEHYFAFAREFAGRVVLLQSQNPAADAREQAYQEMLRDRRFQEHLALRYYSERDVANKYRGLLQQAEAVLAQVRAQVRDQD